MMLPAFVLTFAMVEPIEPVVSDKNTMSGFGGIAGVWTVFVIVVLDPEASAALYDAGVTPPAAYAVAGSNEAPTTISSTVRLRFIVKPPNPLRAESENSIMLLLRGRNRPALRP
jgi:hypothetical protein